MNTMPTMLLDNEYNREPTSSVQPPDWKNPEPAPMYNLVVKGNILDDHQRL